MRKYEIIVGSIKVPLDFLTIFLSFFIARELRLVSNFIPNLPIQTINTESLLKFSFVGSLLLVAVFSIHSLYFIKINASKIKEFLEIILYTFYTFIFFSVLIYLGKGFLFQNEIPRLIIGFAYTLGCIGIIIQRILMNHICYFLINKGYIHKKNIVLVNNKPLLEIYDVIQNIENTKIYNIIGYTNSKEIPHFSGNNEGNLQYLGGIKEMQSIFENNACDEIISIESDFGKNDLCKLWELSRIFGVRYMYLSNNFDITKTNTTLSLINQIPVIEIKNTPLDNWGRILKRIFDMTSGIIGVIFFLPIMIIIGLLIKIEDPQGPIIFKNMRIGQNGKQFNLYKFRYMKWQYCIKESYGIDKKDDAALKFEQELIKKSSLRSGPLYKIQNDPRKTKIGYYIEKFSLDELPQFFNIILGNMSLVGPRPHQPREVSLYELHHKRLLTVKPGITGMAQVNGRDNNDFEKEAELDIFYIENWSLLLDLKIIIKTFSVILKRK